MSLTVEYKQQYHARRYGTGYPYAKVGAHKSKHASLFHPKTRDNLLKINQYRTVHEHPT